MQWEPAGYARIGSSRADAIEEAWSPRHARCARSAFLIRPLCLELTFLTQCPDGKVGTTLPGIDLPDAMSGRQSGDHCAWNCLLPYAIPLAGTKEPHRQTPSI